MLKLHTLKAKTLIGTALSVIVTAGIIITFSIISLRKQAIEIAKEQYNQVAHEESALVQHEISEALTTARTLAQVLGHVVDPDHPIDIPRYEATEMMRSILTENPHYLSVFTAWEPNLYDGFDAGYVNEKGHDSSGRFAPYWIKHEKGEVTLAAMTQCEYHSPEGEFGHWYQEPKNKLKDFIQGPYQHIDKDQHEQTIITVTVPIIRAGKFYGIVGVDLDVMVIQDILEKSDKYDASLLLVLLNSRGRYVAYAGQPEKRGTLFGEDQDVGMLLANGREALNVSLVTNGYLLASSSVPLGRSDSRWSLFVGVPIEQVVSSMSRLIWNQGLLFAGVLASMLLIAMVGVRKLTKPMSVLAAGVKRVNDGDLSQPVIINSRDELGDFAKSFNAMRENLQKTLSELHEHQQDLERKIEDRTAELNQKNDLIESNRQKLKKALDEISALIVSVTKDGSFDSIYNHPELQRCWELEKCERTDCPCYDQGPVRCWQVEGTTCRGETQGQLNEKIEFCSQCQFYLDSTADPIFQIGEQFNNMMYVLKSKNEKLSEAYLQLKHSQATILQQEKMASIGQLAAGVAHEINNPIGFVKSNLSSLERYQEKFALHIAGQEAIIKSHCPDPQIEEVKAEKKKLKIDYMLDDGIDLIKESLDGIERVRVIVQNLKSFSHVDKAERGPTNLNEGIESTLKIIWNELKYKTTVHKELAELPDIICNPQQLNQVFMNLLINAAHAIDVKGDIKIKTSSDADSIQIAISDTGSGIPQEIIPRLFEPFFTTKAVGKGTGLGLSIVYDIVTKNHNGKIDVTSEVGKGTTFTVTLPMTALGTGAQT